MLERIRSRLRPEPEPASGKRARAARPRRVSRREREARQRRLLYITTAIAGAVVVVALIAGASYQYIIYPRHALATVNGEKIQRSEYWKVRGVQLRQQLAQLQNQLQFASGDQATQLQQQLALAQAELSNLRDAPVSAETLGDMIDDLIVMQSLDDFGITITREELDAFLDDQFSPVPLVSPTPTSTPNPTAAAWATETTESRNITATANTESSATAMAATSTAVSLTATALVTPSGSPTPESTAPGTPDATPAVTGTAVATGTATVEATGTAEGTGTPDSTGTPEGSPTPMPSATPAPHEALATSEALWELYENNFLKPSDMSMDDYRRLVAEPTLGRIKIQERLLAEISDTADQVHAAHILVATEEAAREVLARLQTEDFADVAREVSTDTSSAPNGGDLGWFARGVMVAPFEDAAFSLQPGETSEPVQSQFGWHIIRVIEREANRPKTLASLQQEQSASFQKWLDSARASSVITADIAITALTPVTQPQVQPTFSPPPDIPPTPIPTPTTIPTPATPEGSETPGATSTP